jgi:hypothetical protein
MMPARPTIRPPERLLDRYWRVACGAIVAQAKGRPVTEEAKQLARRALGKPATYKAAVTLIEAATSDFQRMMADDLIAERLGHRQPRTERADDQTIAAWMQQRQSIK